MSPVRNDEPRRLDTLDTLEDLDRPRVSAPFLSLLSLDVSSLVGFLHNFLLRGASLDVSSLVGFFSNFFEPFLVIGIASFSDFSFSPFSPLARSFMTPCPQSKTRSFTDDHRGFEASLARLALASLESLSFSLESLFMSAKPALSRIPPLPSLSITFFPCRSA